MYRFFQIASFAFVLSLAFSISYAQSFPPVFFPFSANGQNLTNALAGGLNNPQLSAVDLNNDGILDLFVFDRKGNVVLTFLHDGAPGSTNYTYAPEYLAGFPSLTNWAILRDFNGDGIADIFTYSHIPGIDGISVYRGYYDAQNRIAFNRIQFSNPFGILYFPLPNGSQTQLFVSTIDIPEVVDVDGDGDLDILTFGVAGGYMEYYANRSIEMGFGTDTLIYRLVTNCWGGFYESGVTEAVDLAATSGQCYTPLTGDDGPIEVRHAGSTVTAFDANGNGRKDLVLGDVSFNNLNFLTNGGTAQTAWMTAQDNSFPSYDVPVLLPLFPAAFYLDLDRDGKKDLAVAPNAANGSEDREVLWWYRNTQGIPHHFELQQRTFLVETMLDFGTSANPVFADVNGDGLMDMLVGNGSYYLPFGAKAARLYLFLNVGTDTEPAFELADEDFLNMSQFAASTFNYAPAFGDIDGDGDLDLLVGEDFGLLYFFENTAGPGNPMQFAPHQYPYMGIDVGIASAPFLYDINGDGLTDLLIGERNGNINFFPNLGTPGQPFFQAAETAPNVPFFGRIDARIPGFPEANSAPVVVEVDGQMMLITGTQIGRIEAYIINESDYTAEFPVVTEYWGDIKAGLRSRVALADLNNNGFLEAAIGNARGGLQLFATDIPTPVISSVAEKPTSAQAQVYPNPTGGALFVRLPEDRSEPALFQLFSADGKLAQEARRQGPVWQESLEGLPAGLYFWRISGAGRTFAGKVVLQRRR